MGKVGNYTKDLRTITQNASFRPPHAHITTRTYKQKADSVNTKTRESLPKYKG